MAILDFSRSKALNNIPSRKLTNWLHSIDKSEDSNEVKMYKKIAINRYAESNIPIEYWSLNMEKDFYGDPRLLEKYNEYISDLKSTYITGKSLCFAGSHGVGKTTAVTCILKKCCQKGFSCLYTTLGDIVSTVIQASGEDRFLSRRELAMVDFLVIDEFDPRFMSTDNAADLYARSLEGVFRTRSQNKQPTLMCTNSPNPVESFKGSLRESIDSLMSGYIEIFPVLGEDFRKKER